MKRLLNFVAFWIAGPVIVAVVVTSLMNLADQLRNLNFQ